MIIIAHLNEHVYIKIYNPINFLKISKSLSQVFGMFSTIVGYAESLSTKDYQVN